MSDGDDRGFLSRWSRRKAAVRVGQPVAEPVPPPPAAVAPAVALPATTPTAAAAPADPRAAPGPAESRTATPPAGPTLEDVAQLTRGSDYRRFVAPEVDPPVRNAALKKMFASDPQFNVMDGLDTYIDDYGKPDPIPASMLRQMVQARVLGLFDDEEADAKARQTVIPASGADPDGAAAPLPAPSAAEPHPTEEAPSNDDHAAVRLQPDDAAGPAGAADGAVPDAGRER